MTTTPASPLALPALPEPAIPVTYAPAGGYAPAPQVSRTMTVAMPQPYFTADQMDAHATAAVLADRAGRGDAAGWVSVKDRLPPDLKFVLVACRSGYTTTPFVFTTARRDAAHRPGCWLDHANDGLGVWGMKPTHWQPLPAAPTGETA